MVATGSVAVLEASRGYSTEVTYFADNTYYEIVGEGYIDCNWRQTMYWGVYSDYAWTFDTTCGGGSGFQYCPQGCSPFEKCTTQGCQYFYPDPNHG